jgi:hypothetical protein
LQQQIGGVEFATEIGRFVEIATELELLADFALVAFGEAQKRPSPPRG